MLYTFFPISYDISWIVVSIFLTFFLTFFAIKIGISRLPKDQGNVVLSGTIGCDAMAVVPAGSGALSAGTRLKGFTL